MILKTIDRWVYRDLWFSASEEEYITKSLMKLKKQRIIYNQNNNHLHFPYIQLDGRVGLIYLKSCE